MGHLTRTPTSNEPEAHLLEGNPCGTSDDFFHLLHKSAVRCCDCGCVVSTKYVTVTGDHVFCPDHKASVCETGDRNHHHNVSEFIKHNNLS